MPDADRIMPPNAEFTGEAGSHGELIASTGLYSRLVGQQMAAAVGRGG